METVEFIALVVAVTQLVKEDKEKGKKGLPAHLCPYFAVLFAIGYGILELYLASTVFITVVTYLKYGLMATGLFSTAKEIKST